MPRRQLPRETPPPPNNQITVNAEQLADLAFSIANATTLSREALIRQIGGDPRRDIRDDCGYDKGNPNAEQYREFYERNPIASKVVGFWPRQCWKKPPEVYDDEDEGTETSFEKSFKELCRNLSSQGRESYLKGDEGNALWEYLRRVDELSRVGSYGVLFYGLNDTERPEDLAKPVLLGDGLKLNYLRAFPEHLAEITQLESDEGSPRYGLPTRYSLTFSDPKDQHAGVGKTATTLDVHWTRVRHVADTGVQAPSGEVFAVPCMRAVFDSLQDVKKVYGGGAEGYWKAGVNGLAFETHPSLGTDANIDVAGLKDQMEAFQNSLQKVLAAKGGTWKTLAPNVVDPRSFVDCILEAISIASDVPKRILMGSERGELSSAQDSKEWSPRVMARNTGYLTPRLVGPVVDDLIHFGLLPVPLNSEFSVYWPDLVVADDMEEADRALKLSQALSAYVSSGADGYLSFGDYLILVWRIPKDEAEQYQSEADKLAEEREKEAEELMKEQQKLGVPPNGKPVPGAPKGGAEAKQFLPPVPTGPKPFGRK